MNNIPSDIPGVAADVPGLHLRVEAAWRDGAAAAGGQDRRPRHEDPEAARGHGARILPQQPQPGDRSSADLF